MNVVMKCNKCNERWITDKKDGAGCPKCHSLDATCIGKMPGCPFYNH